MLEFDRHNYHGQSIMPRPHDVKVFNPLRRLAKSKWSPRLLPHAALWLLGAQIRADELQLLAVAGPLPSPHFLQPPSTKEYGLRDFANEH